MKWFQNIASLDDLRRLYRKLAFEHHPDRGGDLRKMQEINHEYELMSAGLINGNTQFSASRKTYEHDVSARMREKIDSILHLPGIMIEIMGSWIWVSGNTWEVKSELKSAEFRFSHNKACWYWHCGGYFKKSGKYFDLDDIRALWGSEEIKQGSAKSQFINR